MKRRARPEAEFTISASAALTQAETRILKQGDTFGVFDPRGDTYFLSNDELGIYHRGTRYLSDFELRIGGDYLPMLLNSHLRDDNGLLNVELTCPDMRLGQGEPVAKGSVHIQRDKFLLDGCCYERVRFQNFSDRPLSLPAVIYLGADYRDIFEIRGMARPRRGELLERTLAPGLLTLGYKGLDGVTRRTRITFAFPLEGRADPEHLAFRVDLAPKEQKTFELQISFCEENEKACPLPVPEAFDRLAGAHQVGKAAYCSVASNSEPFNHWVERSRDDLVMMTTPTPTGELYPYAGIPWYCTPFGRDGIWTALLCLWANPSLSRGVLRYLARTQATEIVPEADSAPGKIIHEVRDGEMARLKEIPFGKYYGSVDSTPLFLLLAGEYFRRTGDIDLLRDLWPSVERGLGWIERHGDADGDGFVEYEALTSKGLRHQGWKDSHDAIFHADGSDATGGIALCEVQGYVYAAKRCLAPAARLLGYPDLEARLEREALQLRERFEKAYWLPELGTYALALDGAKKPCRVRSSNAGHLLLSGLPAPERADALAASLFTDSMFSGWGVRTISSAEPRYNPMSYHNGSVWPHDNAIIALGLARIGAHQQLDQLITGMFQAGVCMEFYRMPEVFCGFPRRDSSPPTLYPLACAPQAWASAVVYALVQALLGIEIDALENRVRFRRPRLPGFLEELRIERLRLGTSSLDAVITRYSHDVGLRIEKRSGPALVVVEH